MEKVVSLFTSKTDSLFLTGYCVAFELGIAFDVKYHMINMLATWIESRVLSSVCSTYSHFITLGNFTFKISQ